VDDDAWSAYVRRSRRKGNAAYRAAKLLDRHVIEPALFRPPRLGWTEVEDMVDELAARVRSDFRPDVVLGVQRGGAIVGRRMAGALGLDDGDPRAVGRIHVTHYPDAWGTTFASMWLCMLLRPARVQPQPGPDLGGRNVLILDDDVATGSTLHAAKRHVLARGASCVRTATLVAGTNPVARGLRALSRKPSPDYSGSALCYGVYPWSQLGGVTSHSV
jgi:hypoxanthine phosphoribosyltransferase